MRSLLARMLIVTGLLVVIGGCREGTVVAGPGDHLTIEFLPPQQILPLGDEIAKYRLLSIGGRGRIEYAAFPTLAPEGYDVAPAQALEALQWFIDAGLLDTASDFKPGAALASSGPLFLPYRYRFKGQIGDRRVELMLGAHPPGSKRAAALIEQFDRAMELLWPAPGE